METSPNLVTYNAVIAAAAFFGANFEQQFF